MSLSELEREQARAAKKQARDEIMANEGIKELLNEHGAKLREIILK